MSEGTARESGTTLDVIADNADIIRSSGPGDGDVGGTGGGDREVGGRSGRGGVGGASATDGDWIAS